jgi:hypothetical protein
MNYFSFREPPPSVRFSLFISHAWRHNDDYEGLKNLLYADAGFGWDNLSVPFDEPLGLSSSFPKSYGTIVDQLRDKIRQADCLLVIAAIYCTYRGWIQTEIEAAKQFGKPIIAVRPLGQERLPAVIQEADEQVGWRTASIIDAIKKLATPQPAVTSQYLASPSQLAGIPTIGRYGAVNLLERPFAQEPASENIIQGRFNYLTYRPKK